MRIILSSRAFYVLGAIVLIALALFSLTRVLTSTKDQVITASVTRGDVSLIVPVSGIIESETAASIAFPISDIVATVNVREGDVVLHGDILATLVQGGLAAEKKDAEASLEIARATRDELISGPREEAMAVTESSVQNAETNLKRTIIEEDEKVENAKRTLLSRDLEALPENANNDDTAPIISGTYTCTSTGSYTLDLYTSSAQSGTSYRLQGLETTTGTAYTESPAPMGTCGLNIQFAANTNYGNKIWNIQIPNTRATSYVSNFNTYELAKKERANKIQAAEEALDVALRQQSLDNATPRDEELRRANATVMQAEARIAIIEARMNERTLIAPFNARITKIEMITGETATAAHSIELLGETPFILTARIPEIDIAKIEIGQVATVIFDAERDMPQEAKITFISPIATLIDGVAYFEVKLALVKAPSWLRTGLNADIDIIIKEEREILRIPKRFITQDENGYSVHVRNGKTITEVPITVTFFGNDGFAAIEGLSLGDEVVTN